jgi:hypothetical protein
MSNLTPRQAALCDWLRRHDIDPGTIPNDAAFTRETQTGIWTIEFASIDDGPRAIRFVEREPFPDKPQRPESSMGGNDLAAWLRAQLDQHEQHARDEIAADIPDAGTGVYFTLDDIEAKRQILDLHAPVRMTAGWGCPTDGIHGWCPTIRWLAHPLAGQPGYLDAWKPWRP